MRILFNILFLPIKIIWFICKWSLFWWILIPKRLIFSNNKESNAKKSNFLEGVIATAVSAKKMREAINPPTVIIVNEHEGYFVKGLKPKGLTQWKIEIGQKIQIGSQTVIRSKGFATVSKSTKGGNACGARYMLSW